MAVTKDKKKEIIAELTDLFKNSKSVVFSNYQGISVKDVQTLRRNLRENDSQFKVAKKTLIKLAAKNAGFDEIPEEALEGQVGVAFSMGDEIAAAKTLYDFSKTNDSVKLLSAFMEGKTLSKEETLELAKIPGKDELLAKMVGSMKSPISGFHGILYSLLRSFVGVVDAYKDSLPAEEAPKEATPAPAEEKVEEAPKEEAKADEPAKEAAPEGDAPAEEKPDEEATPAPTEEKVEEAPKEEAKADEPAKEAAPEGDAPAEEKPDEEAPKEDPSPEASDPEEDNK
jgi:large subunit ribosomal protein L10